VFPVAVVAILAVVLLPSLVLFPLTVLFAHFVKRRAHPLATLIAFPAALAALEYLVSLTSLHGIYISMANSQIGHPIALQTASLFGMFAITFLIGLSANALAMLASNAAALRVPAVAGLAVCALAFAFAAWRLHQPQAAPERVAAIAFDDRMAGPPQPGVPLPVSAANALATAVRAAAAKGARVIVTHEGSLFSRPSFETAVLTPMARAAHDGRAAVVTGVAVMATPTDHASPSADMAVAFRPNGAPVAYVKRHLLHPLEDNFVEGHARALLGGGLAMAICKDMDFPVTLRQDANAGDIRLMAVPAGDLGLDGWMHGRLALMRGVENGFTVVRPATDGLILIGDAYGRIVDRVPVARHGVTTVVADVSPGPGATLYTHIGDVFAQACVGVTVLLALFMILARRNRSLR
jgi:apolipoprotein N-acyltransferase